MRGLRQHETRVQTEAIRASWIKGLEGVEAGS